MTTLGIRRLTCVVLLTLSAAATAQQSAPQQPARDPALTPEQAEFVEILAGFYRRVGASVPGRTETMTDTVANWSREVRTIRVKVGTKRADSSEGRGRMPPMVDVYETQRHTRLRFGPFTGAGNTGTNAEYDPETGLLTINSDLVGRLRPDRDISPNGESAVRQLTLRIEYAQTLIHETIHSGQGPDAGSPANEAIAYRGALQTTHDWLTAFERNYDAARTKDNARYVWAAADAWLGYLGTITNEIIPKGTATADALPLNEAETRNTEAARVRELLVRIAAEHRTIEILEQMAGPAIVPGSQRTLDEMLIGLTAHDFQELDQRVAKAARAAVESGAGDLRGGAQNYTPVQRDEKAKQLADGALPLIRNEWRRKLQAVAAAVRKLEAFTPLMRFRPEAGAIDPETGTAKVTVDVENDAAFAKLVDALGKALQAATGDPAKLTVVDSWNATNLPKTDQVWRSGIAKTFEFSKPQDYWIDLRRTVFTRVDIASPRIPPKIQLETRDLYAVEPPEVPTAADLAGIWTGSLIITEMPMLQGVAAGATPPAAEACQFPIPDLSRLRELQGKPFAMSAELKPRSETEGVIVLSLRPPEGFMAEPGEPQRLPYRYASGALTVSMEPQRGVRLVMKAIFSRAEDRWKFRGDWSLWDNTQNRNVKAIGGTWTGSKAVK